jgi:hypothetical protein
MDVKTLKSKLCDTIKLMATDRPYDSYQVSAEKELPADNDEFEEFVFEVMDEIGANLYEFYLPSYDFYDSYFKFIYEGVDMRCYMNINSENEVCFCIGFNGGCCCKLVSLDE